MSFATIDFSTIAPPDIVEPLNYEVILGEMIADLQARDPAFTALVESDPAFKILEVAAYRELLLRQRVNDAARGVMLAYAARADLDQLGANMGLIRNVIDLGNPDAFPPVAPTMESDEEFRKRIQLAPEALSVAGPTGAYVFHALAVPDVADVSVVGPPTVDPGEVLVTVLGRSGDGVPSQATLDAVSAALEDVRPLTDQVTIQGAALVDYAISATIYTYAGPDPETVLAAAQEAADAYVVTQRRLGHDVTLSGVYAALHRPGVQRVELSSPVADVVITHEEVANCTGITLTIGGVGE
ncbi:MAG TPA: baseplate J/gp47 family protein [Chthoniobacteraceae bacterium]|nr:baseplate J/gp47 family protein [Chthoniobacteraceae bacterium]